MLWKKEVTNAGQKEPSWDPAMTASTEHSQTAAQTQLLTLFRSHEYHSKLRRHREHQGARSRARGLDGHVYPAGSHLRGQKGLSRSVCSRMSFVSKPELRQGSASPHASEGHTIHAPRKSRIPDSSIQVLASQCKGLHHG